MAARRPRSSEWAEPAQTLWRSGRRRCRRPAVRPRRPRRPPPALPGFIIAHRIADLVALPGSRRACDRPWTTSFTRAQPDGRDERLVGPEISHARRSWRPGGHQEGLAARVAGHASRDPRATAEPWRGRQAGGRKRRPSPMGRAAGRSDGAVAPCRRQGEGGEGGDCHQDSRSPDRPPRPGRNAWRCPAPSRLRPAPCDWSAGHSRCDSRHPPARRQGRPSRLGLLQHVGEILRSHHRVRHGPPAGFAEQAPWRCARRDPRRAGRKP